MNDADHGDENDARPAAERLCVMCGEGLARARLVGGHRVWVTPVIRWEQPPWLSFEARTLDPAFSFDHEQLLTCMDGKCIAQARAFADQQRMSPAKKQTIVWRIWKERELGLQPYTHTEMAAK